ncbi:MAG: NIPSNAP family protein [Acidobacteria bacterium]|nr:NIPSNAP family protein [Acidobacteriota bacterium]
MKKFLPSTLIALLALVIGYGAGQMDAKTSRVYELRTYTAAPGKIEALHARFRNHTLKLFEKHGMKNIAYWAPSDDPLKANTLIYVVAHESREAAKKSWDAFRVDPEWIKARDASEVGGKLTAKVESVYMEATDYSPMK